MTKYTYDGKTLSLSAWAKELDIPYMTLRDRLVRGWSVDEAFSTPSKKKSFPKNSYSKLEYDGRTMNATQWAKEFDIPVSTITGRISRGWTMEQVAAGVRHRESKAIVKEPLYSVWNGIKSRCYNEKAVSYKDYGARGIKMHGSWRQSYKEFKDYIEALPGAAEGTTLDRIDNDGNYEPGNLRWATWDHQANNRRNNIWVEYNGEVKTASQWADEHNLSSNLVIMRLQRGWDIHRALNTPARQYGT